MANTPPITLVTTSSDREITITRVFDAPRRLVFAAWTDPAHLPHWMLGPEGWTMPTCEVDLRPGGAWRFGWHHSDGGEMAMHGIYHAIIAPEQLVLTESWGGEWPETLNTLLLAESAATTTITLQIVYPSRHARDAALQSGMQEGMALSFNRLDAYLATLA